MRINEEINKIAAQNKKANEQGWLSKTLSYINYKTKSYKIQYGGHE